MREINCHSCGGTRLRPETLYVTVAGRNITGVADLSIRGAFEYLDALSSNERETRITERVVRKIRGRLCFLLDISLDYPTLSRSVGSLSGGEAQCIRLATQTDSGLIEVLYVLDESSIGLHRRDNRWLVETLVRLRDLDNALIVAKHDENAVRATDRMVDIGPGAGEHNGEVMVSRPVEELLTTEESLTGRYLSGKLIIDAPTMRHPGNGKSVTVVSASENGLQDVDVSFPLGRLITVTGVSGPGRSSLADSILYAAATKQIYGTKAVSGKHRKPKGLENLNKVIQVNQSPISRTPCSNPATYTGVFDKIHGLFATTPGARVRGCPPGWFSFDVKGGCCESCSGDGITKIEVNSLSDVYVPCEICHGAWYNRETLEVHYKGRSISGVLQVSINEGARFFESTPTIVRRLKTLEGVRPDYIHLGQPATTLSGDEAQRVKLAAGLQKRSTGRTLYVLDEPTTGLHFEDIRKLLAVLHRPVDARNTVVVIGYNLDAIKSADWIIDMGPGSGSCGGQMVATGTPEEVTKVTESAAGGFLAPLLGR